MAGSYPVRCGFKPHRNHKEKLKKYMGSRNSEQRKKRKKIEEAFSASDGCCSKFLQELSARKMRISYVSKYDEAGCKKVKHRRYF
jgi:hypothetical protein